MFGTKIVIILERTRNKGEKNLSDATNKVERGLCLILPCIFERNTASYATIPAFVIITGAKVTAKFSRKKSPNPMVYCP